MPSRHRLPPERWRDWYAAQLANADTTLPGEVLASWARLAAPAYYLRGAPTESELAARPDDFLQHDGQWWEISPEPVGRPDGQWQVLLDGSLVVRPDGTTITDREQARRELRGPAMHPLAEQAVQKMATGRQDGRRSSHQVVPLIRALAILGLTDSDLSHAAAVELWLEWERELGGPESSRLQHPDFDAVEYVDSMRKSTRQVWARHELHRL